MARSQYIYVILEENRFEYKEVAATFTVKHECLTWMKKNPPKEGVIRELYRHSGSGAGRTQMDIEKELKANE